jgi:hypothetical protein
VSLQQTHCSCQMLVDGMRTGTRYPKSDLATEVSHLTYSRVTGSYEKLRARHFYFGLTIDRSALDHFDESDVA